MGGAVAFTLRLPSGEEHRMCRWTNMMPWAINNIKLIQKDKKHIKEVMEQWVSMQKDWEKHKKTKKFDFPMTEYYVPYKTLEPIEYGVIVVDMVNDVILTMQGYCSFGNVDSLGAQNDLRGSMAGGEDFDRLYQFFKTKRVISASTFDKGIEITVPLDYLKLRNKKTLAASLLDGFRQEYLATRKPVDLDDIDDEFGFDDKWLRFKLDMSPFKVEKFQEDNSGSLDFMRRVQELGFKLSKKEQKGFTYWRD